MNELQRFLLDPKFYPEQTRAIECVETHISRVYLSERSAYKFKKPLQLDFLDYSHLESRHEACLAELAVNRPFAPDIYQDVVQVCRGPDGRLCFGGPGEVVDYAVRMRRYRDADRLDIRLKDGRLDEADARRVRDHLHACLLAMPQAKILPGRFIRRFQDLIRDNAASIVASSKLLGLNYEGWEALSSRLLLFTHLSRDLFESRIRDGRVRLGHGDIRPEHIIIEEKRVSLMDGIEFDDELRTLDQADELAFLEMECAVLGHAVSGSWLREQILSIWGDHPPRALLSFYMAYRASVRAKVNLLYALQSKAEERAAAIQRVQLYLEFAQANFLSQQGNVVFIFSGPMASGKSSLAQRLQTELLAVHLETDQIRREILGASPKKLAYDEGIYSESQRLQVYDVMKKRLLDSLKRGTVAILDGSFGEPKILQMMLATIQAHATCFVLVRCSCPDQVAIERITQRQRLGASPSEARSELYAEQLKRGHWEFTDLPHIEVDTLASLDFQLHQVLRFATLMHVRAEQQERLNKKAIDRGVSRETTLETSRHV